MLPFLENTSRWPTSKEPEERVVNPSYNKKIQDQLVDELLMAMEHKNSKAVKDCILSLIHEIQEEEERGQSENS